MINEGQLLLFLVSGLHFFNTYNGKQDTFLHCQIGQPLREDCLSGYLLEQKKETQKPLRVVGKGIEPLCQD